jgi:Tol biopolymer transport system component
VAATKVQTPTSASPVSLGKTEPGGKIVFTCQIDKNENSDQICIMNVDGSNFRQLTHNSFENYYPSLAPDGNSIVFASNQTGNFEIYEMDLGGNQKILTSRIGELSAPEISPDGSQIVFTNNYSKIAHIWVMKSNGGNPHEVYGANNQDSLDPVWSPDGKQILFAIGTGENRRLHVINKDGTGLKQININIVTRGRNDWSPDGITLGTYSGASWHREIYLFNLDGSNLRQISNGGNVLAPSFSPDGQWIAFTGYIHNYGDDNGCEIYIMRIDGTDVRRLTNNNYCDLQPRWGP